MAGNVIQNLSVIFGAETAKLVNGVNTVNKHLSRFEKRTQAAMTLLKRFGGVIAVSFGARAVKAVIDSGDAMAKYSRSVGLTTEQLSKLEFAAERSGLSVAELRTGISNLNKQTADARDGLSTAVRAFNKLGISAQKFGKLDTRAKIGVLIEAFKGITDEADRTQVAMQLLGGRAGKKFLQLIEAGTEDLAKMEAMAEDLGLVLSDDTARSMEEFNDSLTAAGKSINILIAENIGPLLPALTAAINGAVKVMQWFRNRGAEIAKEFKDTWEEVQGPVKGALGKIGDAFKGLGDKIKESLGITDESIGKFTASMGLLQQVMGGGSNIPLVGPVIMAKKARDVFKEWVKSGGDVVETYKAIAEVAEEAGKTVEDTVKTTKEDLANVAGFTPFGTGGAGGGGGGGGAKKQFDFVGEVFKDAQADIRTWSGEYNRAQQSVDGFIASQRRTIKLNDSNVTGVERLWLEYSHLDEQLKKMALRSPEEAARRREEIELNHELIESDRRRAESLAAAADVGREVGQVIASGFEEAIFAGKKFQDVIKAVAEDLLRLGTRKLISEPLIAGFSKAAQGLSSGNAMQALATFFGFGTAQHGGFPAVGRPVLVGEAGPEVFVPTNAGRILPNQQLQAMANSGGGVTVNMSISTPDVDSFRQSQSQIAADIGRLSKNATRRFR